MSNQAITSLGGQKKAPASSSRYSDKKRMSNSRIVDGSSTIGISSGVIKSPQSDFKE